MRFVFFSTCPEAWGGSEELWAATAAELRARGHDVEALKPNADLRHPRIRRLRQAGCRVRELDPILARRVAALANALAPERYAIDSSRRQMVSAARALLAPRCSLAMISQGQTFDGLYLAELCRRLRLPYAVLCHKASDIQWPADFERPACVRALRGARLTMFVSQSNRIVTEQQLGIDLENAVVVRNPINAGRNGPLAWPAPGQPEIRLACVGRLYVAEKGQDLLLRVLAGERWRRRPLHVSFFGAGSHRQGLEELARRLGVERVSFEGHVASIDDVWSTHHALVLPSRAEGLPLTVAEAMMCGRPVIATDVGGTAEFVEDGCTGFIAESASVAALDATLERAWGHLDAWPEMGSAGAARIRELVPGDPARDLTDLLLAAAGATAPG